MDFLSDNDVLYKFPIQFLSTDSYLSYFYDKITKGFNSGFLTVIVFIDLQKAYDATYHIILIKKCLFEVLMMSRSSGANHISQTESLWSANRKFMISIQNSYSDKASIKSGMPQGSILGPLISLVYINAILLTVVSERLSYALPGLATWYKYDRETSKSV